MSRQPKIPDSLRGQLLIKAKQLTCTEREMQYGDPLKNFEAANDLKRVFWKNTALPGGVYPGAYAHAIDMILTKLARIATAPTLEAALAEDHYADGAAYFALAYEVGKRSLE